MDRESKYYGNCRPIYLNFNGEEVEMQKNTAYFEVFLNIKQLSFSPNGQESSYIFLSDLQIERSFIQHLREAIY